jgi:4,5-DOPA dioxygenase extradiol
MVSAHWEEAPIAVGATTTVPLVYDFWGFPEHYYQVKYPAPGAPALAGSVRKLLSGPGESVRQVPGRGLDHGAYVPLVEMFPEADIPVLQLSMPTLEPKRLLELGRRLAPLRDEGVLIIGSGFFTHNLRAIAPDGQVSSVMAEFDEWGRQVLAAHDLDALLDFEHKAPAGHLAHPRTRALRPALRHPRRRRRRAGQPADRHRGILAGAGQAVHPDRLMHAWPPGSPRGIPAFRRAESAAPVRVAAYHA